MTSVIKEIVMRVGLVVGLLLGGLAHANLVVNGGFEDSAPDFTPAWTAVGPQDNNFVVVDPAPGTFGTHGGDNIAFFGSATEPSGVQQSIATLAAHRYLVTFLLANLGGGANDDPTNYLFSVTTQGAGNEVERSRLDASVGPDAQGGFDFRPVEFEFDADGSTLLSFAFQHGASWWALDDVSVTDITRDTQIPEPATLFLFAIALATLAVSNKRKQLD